MSNAIHTEPDSVFDPADEVDEVAVELHGRKQFITGLRNIAAFLEEHPEVPLPYLGAYAEGSALPALSIYVRSYSWDTKPDQRSQLATIARAMGRAEKRVHGGYFHVWREFAGIVLCAQADRDEVCERIVTGSHEVTEEVPDPLLVAQVPIITRTRTVEDVRWVCPPLLVDPVHERLGGSSVPS